MMRRIAVGVMLLGQVTAVGCSQPSGPPRLKTSPVSGTVHVDGEPAAMLTVTCYPDAGASEQVHPSFATTDADGNFAMSTYKAGDGLPAGSYILTFEWKTLESGRKDKLKGAYTDPKRSSNKITVAAGEPVDLGVFELSTKGSSK